MRHAYRLHLGFHAEVASGVLVSRTSSDLLQIQQPFIMIPLLFSGLVMLLGAIALLSLVSVPLMLVSLSPTAAILVVSVRFTGRLGPQSQAVQRELAATSAEVGEAFTGVASIKGLGAEKAALAALQARTTRVFDATMGLTRLRASYLPFFDFQAAASGVGAGSLGKQRRAHPRRGHLRPRPGHRTRRHPRPFRVAGGSAAPITFDDGVDRESSLDIPSGKPHAVVYGPNSHLGGFRLVHCQLGLVP